jgi:hypothetical protein
MSNQYYDRYQDFVVDGEFLIIPGIQIPLKSTDQFIQYKKGIDRLDKISQDRYNTPLFSWLIMLANPSAGPTEFEIPDNTTLRIPFPLINTLQDYKKAVELYKLYYGEQ